MTEQIELIDLCDNIANRTADPKTFADAILTSVRIIIETALTTEATIEEKRGLAKHAIKRLEAIQ